MCEAHGARKGYYAGMSEANGAYTPARMNEVNGARRECVGMCEAHGAHGVFRPDFIYVPICQVSNWLRECAGMSEANGVHGATNY